MELLLNLIWALLALGAFFVLLGSRHSSVRRLRVPYLNALIALSCIVWLLFPVVSASDDLHPTQAVVEDATRRVQQSVAAVHQLTPSISILPSLLASFLLAALIVLAPWRLTQFAPRLLEAAHIPLAGRGPPRF